MASCLFRVARRPLPPAAAAATVAIATLTFCEAQNDARRAADDGPVADAARPRRGLLDAGGRFAWRPGAGAFPWRATVAVPWWTASAALCEAPPPPRETKAAEANAPYRPSDPAEPVADPAVAPGGAGPRVAAPGTKDGPDGDAELYHGLFPRRQLWRPAVEYPLWDSDWDGRAPPPAPSDAAAGEAATEVRRAQDRDVRRRGVTRHVILVRHGQYSEVDKEDAKRLLTPLGRRQAELTGQRLGALVRGASAEFGPCRVKVVRVSDLARAKETADIIYEHMGVDDTADGEGIERAAPDPLLNEGMPCHTIPGRKARPSAVERHDDSHPRIERAFRKYFYRADPPAAVAEEGEGGSGNGEDPNAEKSAIVATSSQNAKPESPNEGAALAPHPQHEFEIVVCHGNVIRYFFCRALQLPPEAWLRLCTFNCSLTYFTIRPTGTVSCRMLGDIGHLPYDLCTFSMHPGFNW